jgi:hypothetical protein
MESGQEYPIARSISPDGRTLIISRFYTKPNKMILFTRDLASGAERELAQAQSIGDSSGFVYPPLTLSTLFQPTYDLGARVHSDSWGSPVFGKYTFYSQQVDEFVTNYRDFVLVFPMGNDGKEGIVNMKKANNAVIISQDEQSCVVYGMPKSAVSTGVVDAIVPLKEIPEVIVKYMGVDQ